jgi:hypothetical protein
MAIRKRMIQNLKYKVVQSVIDSPEQLQLLKLMVDNADQFNLAEETVYEDGSKSVTIQIHYRDEVLSKANKQQVLSKKRT